MAVLPSHIGNFEVIRQLGSGGMGTVYLGRDAALNRKVAIKMLREQVQDEELLARFLREAQAAANLRHPNIITIHATGHHEYQPYIVMEFVEGESLADVTRQRRPVTLADKLSYLEQILVGHVPVLVIRHQREERATVVPDPFADGARQLVVRPSAGAGLRVRRDVRHVQPRDSFPGPAAPALFRARPWRKAGRVPVDLAVAEEAAAYGGRQVPAALEALGRTLERPIGERPCPRPDGWPDADDGGERRRREDQQREQGETESFEPSTHGRPPRAPGPLRETRPTYHPRTEAGSREADPALSG